MALDSELVFIGHAGNTEAARPSQRYGGEWSNRWRAMPWILVDLDLAWNHARFTEDAPEGNYLTGTPSHGCAMGLSFMQQFAGRHGAKRQPCSARGVACGRANAS